ncbi:MAG TPA: hypothetical protein VF960_02795 [Chloroflexota bacterium]
MLIIYIVAVGIVVGIVAHLILGSDGYSWFGEIILGIVGAILFGLMSGILVGEREFRIEPVAFAAVGAVIVEAIAIVLTFRSVGRGFGGSAK